MGFFYHLKSRARFNVAPLSQCYGRGTLRGARATTYFTVRGNETHPLPSNPPLAFFVSGAERVFIEFFFHHNDSSVTEECMRKEDVRGETIDVSVFAYCDHDDF